MATPTPDPSPTTSGTQPPSPTAEPPSPTSSATPQAINHISRRGGTLRLWKTAEDRGLDPGIYHLKNKDILYSTLTQPMTYQPTKNLFAMDGMTGYEQVDPVTLVWSIRPGMKFRNGDPVDSEAVAFSFGRIPKLWEALDGTHVPRIGFDFVDSFEATDVLTLTEHWERPNADALVHRARHYYSFLNPRVVEAQGEVAGVYAGPDGPEDVFSVQDLPVGVGSGPYTIARRDAEGTRVERWPDYFRHRPADDGFVEDGPLIDGWETRILPDREAAKQAFIAGKLDVFDTIHAEEIPEFEGLDDVSVTEVPNGGYSMLGMDGAKFHDVRARQALRMAIDYEAFIATMRPFGGKYGAPISDLLPHFQKLTQEDLQGWYHHDPREARALWEAADVELASEPFSVAQSSDASSPQFPISEFTARTLHEVLGIGTEVSSYSLRGGCFGISSLVAFGAPLSCSYDRREAKEWDLFSYGTGESGGTTGLPDDNNLVFYDPRAYGGAAFNFHEESSRPEIAADSVTLTAMLEAQEQEADFDVRVELLTDIQRWILDNAWCTLALPISSVSYYGFSSRLADHAPEEWLNYYGLRRESMWLA